MKIVHYVSHPDDDNRDKKNCLLITLNIAYG